MGIRLAFLLSVLSAGALESRIELSADAQGVANGGLSAAPWTAGTAARQGNREGAPATRGEARAIGAWTLYGAVAKPGFKGKLDIAPAHAAYRPDGEVDLLLHFDAAAARDETGAWEVSYGHGFAIDGSRALLGAGAGFFGGPDSAVAISPRTGKILGGDSSFRDFSIEFWLFPANAENGEVMFLWQSVRSLKGGVLPQQVSCVVAGGRLHWSFSNLFAPPGASKPEEAAHRVQLRGRDPLVPRTWSHHLLRFDGDTGLLEYLADGEPEAVAYATSTGREGGTVFQPWSGARAPLRFCPEYSGLADELRITRRFVEDPSLRPFGKEGAVALSPVVDLGYGDSVLISIEAGLKAPGSSGVELAYRIDESWSSWWADSPAWTPFRPGEALPGKTRGRYVQVRAELFPDGSGQIGPSLSSIELRFEPNPPPPPPARLVATPMDGAVELAWSRVPEADLAGYLVYYGDLPGEYFGTGADQGPSPIDAGAVTSIRVTGIPNGKLVFFAIAAYDGPPSAPGGAAAPDPAARAGEFSTEAAARPSRTAR